IYTKNGGPERFGGREFPLPELPRDHPFREFFDQFRRGQPGSPDEGLKRPSRAQGSGFLISSEGYVVTTHHVTDKADEIEASLESEEKYSRKVAGSDPRTDIALLKIEGNTTSANYVRFAEKAPRAGDWALAFGNPFGLGGTVTAGMV